MGRQVRKQSDRHAGNRAPLNSGTTYGPGRRALALLMCLLLANLPLTQAYALDRNALPTGGQVTAGSAAIQQSGSQMTIQQGSQQAIIDWQHFNIGADAGVTFRQPNSSAMALNRVIGGDPSQIFGKLNANGQLFLVNAAGILFAPGSQVDVGGLTASTMNITNDDFLGGRMIFHRDGSTASVVNQGTITAADGGHIALLGATVRNEGLIRTRFGQVILAAGETVTMNAGVGGYLQVAVDPATVSTLVENKELIQADGGQVLMTARAAGELLSAVVSNSGTVQARTLENRDGKIMLLGDMEQGQAMVGGTLDASAPDGGNGGFIETSAAHVKIVDSAKITTLAPHGTTGTWLIDPTDYTIAASGGDITGAALSANLGSTNVTILSDNGTHGGTNGDVNVNDAVNWNANTTLTLQAQRTINVNATITATGTTAGLTLTPALGGSGSYNLNRSITLSGSAPSLTIAGHAYTVINNVTALQNMNSNLGGYYALGSDIDASATSGWNGGVGFLPVGNSSTPFAGTFDGLSHTIGNLSINQSTGSQYVGLFGYTDIGSVIRNVGLAGGSVTGGYNVGSLVGFSKGTINNTFSSANVHAVLWVGGLVGYTSYTTVNNSYATGAVTASGNSYADAGGLIGYNDHSNVTNCYAAGLVSAPAGADTGGLVGYYASGAIINSFWDKTGTGQGLNPGGGTGLDTANMKNSANFASWDFTSVWRMYDGHSYPLLKSFLTPVTVSANDAGKTYDGTSYSGSNGYSTSNPSAFAGLSGALSYGGTSQGARNAGSYSIIPSGLYDTLGQKGYDIIYVNGALTINKAALTITATSNSKTYDGTNSAAAAPTVSGLQSGDNASGLSEVYADKNAGSGKTLSVSGYTVNDGNSGNNYTVTTVADTTGVINKAALTITATSNSKTYDGTSSAAAAPTVSGLQTGDSASGLSEVYADKNAGSGKTISVSGYTVNDGNSGNNYTVTTVADTTGVINKAALTITATTNSKTYDGTSSAAAAPTVSGLQSGDNASGLTETYDTKNAGSGKTLTVNGYTVNDGNSGNNYTVTTVADTTGVINKAALTITAASNSKTYDGTSSAAAAPTVSGLQSGDTATGLSEVYADKNAGNGKTLSVNGYTVNDGNSGNNYTVTTVADTSGVINKAALTITATANTKTYDGTNSAAAAPTVSGLQTGDTTTGLSEAYADRNAGSGKTLSVNGYTVNDGNGGNNYTVTTVNDTTGVINKAALTITAASNTKTYDGTNAAAAAPTVAGLQTGDTATGLSEVYADKNAGSGKTISVSGYTVNDGNGGNNYTVTTVNDTTGVINKAALTITATTNSKTYDGTSSATAAPTVSGLQSGDTATGLSEVYADKNAGSGKTISVSGYTVNDGNSGNNYTVTTVADTTGVINKAALTITATSNSKTYDGTSSAAAAPTVSGLQTGDSASGLSEVYADKNAGSGKTLSVSGYTVNDGNSGNNYTVTTVADTTGVINKAALTITATTNSKTYDGTSSAAAAPTVSGLQSGDNASGLTETYDTKNAGSGKTLSVNGYTVNDGNSGNNYTVTTVNDTTGVINKAALTITATSNSKAYDGTNSAVAAPTVAGLQTGDSASGLSEVYADKNAGSGKTISVSGYTVNDGNGGNNYTVTTVNDTTGVINKAALTITAASNSKTYDGTNAAAAAPTVAGLQTGDSTSGMSEVYADKNAGSGKTLSVNGYTVNDGNSGNNYTVTTVADTTGVINKAALTITATSNSKTYDGTNSATAAPTVSGLQTGDSASGLSEVYADKNAGSGKTLTVNGYTVNDGNGGNNYIVTTVANTTGIINKAALTITATSNSKTYDGTNSATAAPTVSGLQSGDNASGLTETYDTKNAGSGKTLSVNGYTVNDGNSGNNYTVTTVNNTTGVINKAALTITAAANSKTYDGTNSAAAGPTVSGLQTGDSASGLTETYDTKNAGTGKTISVSGYMVNDGNGGNNYTVTTVADTTSIINKATLTAGLTGTVQKTYDGTTAAALTSGNYNISGIVSGDTVALNNPTSGTYDTKNAGTSKTVSVTGLALSGVDAGNYQLSSTSATGNAGQINKAALTITATPNSKTYDGTTTAAAAPTVTGLQTGDTATGLNEIYADKDAGSGKTLSVSGYTVNDGNGGNNYTVTTVNDTTGVITPASRPVAPPTNTVQDSGGLARLAAVATPDTPQAAVSSGELRLIVQPNFIRLQD